MCRSAAPAASWRLRRAARAVQCGDAEFVVCVAGDTNHVDSFRNMLSTFSRFAQDAVYPYGSGGPNAAFALITRNYMNALWRDPGGFRQDLRGAARPTRSSFPHALMKKPLTLDDYLSARAISDPIHLYDCVMPCAGAEAFLVCREDDGAVAWTCSAARASRDHRTSQCLSRRSDPVSRRLGDGRRGALRHGRDRARATSISWRPMTTIRSSA